MLRRRSKFSVPLRFTRIDSSKSELHTCLNRPVLGFSGRKPLLQGRLSKSIGSCTPTMRGHMRKQLIQWGCAGFAGVLAFPGAAFAQQQQAYTNSPVYVFAGPAEDYPAVAQLPGGVPVTVMGCVSDYSWCDVVVPNLRGWVYGANLSYPYQGNNVPILTYGMVIGLPIVTFSIGPYWDRYYRGRPWYNDRSRWESHPPPRREPGGG